jgi:hypothetical protein
MSLGHPTIITCDACFYADDVTAGVDTVSGDWVYKCANPTHGPTPHVWAKAPPVGVKPLVAYQDDDFPHLVL